MSIHFAAARPAVLRNLAGFTGPVSLPRAANDNAGETLNDTLLRAALKHFGKYGLGAAENAHAEAERAFFIGDSDAYRWWLAVCRTLDRRMADRLANSSGATDCREG